MKSVSDLQTARYAYKPKLPAVLNGAVEKLSLGFGKKTEAVSDKKELKELFAHTYGKPLAQVQKGKNPAALNKIKAGVILSGGQAPGGHNVICGLYDGIKKGNEDSILLGFKGGPSILSVRDAPKSKHPNSMPPQPKLRKKINSMPSLLSEATIRIRTRHCLPNILKRIKSKRRLSAFPKPSTAI